MEILNTIAAIPYVFHYLIVTGVFCGAVLLFVFGFKSVEEPEFSKVKTDSKSVSKKKKGKEKHKHANGNVIPVDNKVKTNSTPKIKNKITEEKNKKSNALKESKNNSFNVKNVNDLSNVKSKKKGKENESADFSDDEGNWEQALLHKKNRKGLNMFGVVPENEKQQPNKRNKVKNVKKDEKKQKENKIKKEVIPKDDGAGVWQEAKSSKKRRKFQKE